MVSAVKSGFGGLLRFSGRDARPTFWFYFLTVFVLYMLLSMVASVPMMNAIFASEEEPDFGPFFLMTGVGIGLIVVLLAAAVTRRLHDSGLRGYWGLLPLPFLTGALFAFPRAIEDVDSRIFVFIAINNLLYMAVVAILIVLLVRRGTDGPNRFGEAPGAV